MRVLVDTSVLIDHLRGDPRAVALLARHAGVGDELWSITVVRTEILAGLRRGEEAETWRLLDALLWQDVDKPIADQAGAMAAKFRAAHGGVDTVDYLLAAAAQRLDARLLTQNVKHFPMIKGLRAAYAR